MKVSYTLLMTGLATQQVTATWNLFGNPFQSPNYNDNECNEKQRSGFDWSELKEGISNFEYNDFDFSGGWKCANSFNKRDHITRRTFGSKCIKNKVRKDKSASFGCSKRKSGFSIDYIDVSVEYDVSLDLHFTMGDGSICRMLDVGCKTDGNSIKNTQCGGATSVEVYLGSRFSGDKDECEIGFHNIGFNCDKDKTYTTPTFQIPSSTVPIESQPVSAAPPTETTTPCMGESCNTQPLVTSGTTVPCDGKLCNPQTASTAPPTETTASSCEGESCTQPPISSGISTPCDEGSCYPQPPVATGSIETPAISSTVVEMPPISSTLTDLTSVSFSLIGSTLGSSVPIETPPASQTTPAIETPIISCDESDGEDCITSFITITSMVTRQSGTPFTLSTAVPLTSSLPVYSSSPDSSDTLVPPPVGQSSIVPPQSQSSVELPPISSSGSAPPIPESSGASPPGYGGYGESCNGSNTAVPSTTMDTSAPVASLPPISTGISVPSYSNSTSPPPSSTGTPSSLDPPDVLPRCMNTWIQMNSTMQCKDNTDSDCYCKIKDFTKNVIDCVSAWCNDEDETKEALQYLIGICADHVEENPGIVTDCPTYIPLTSTTPTTGVSTTAMSASVVETPCTTITVGSVEVAVPQVHFTTQQGAEQNPTAPVDLATGTAPAQTFASTTAALYPTVSTIATLYPTVSTVAAPYPTASTIATFLPSGTGAYASSPAEFTGAASPFGVDVSRILVGAVLALVAL